MIKDELKNLISNGLICVNPKSVTAIDEHAHANLVFLSGEAQPLFLAPGDRRYAIFDYETHTQPRLFIGPFQLVQAPAASRHAQTVWALPGGDRATTAQLLVLARRRGWKRPRVIEVTVRRRVSVTG